MLESSGVSNRHYFGLSFAASFAWQAAFIGVTLPRAQVVSCKLDPEDEHVGQQRYIRVPLPAPRPPLAGRVRERLRSAVWPIRLAADRKGGVGHQQFSYSHLHLVQRVEPEYGDIQFGIYCHAADHVL